MVVLSSEALGPRQGVFTTRDGSGPGCRFLSGVISLKHAASDRGDAMADDDRCPICDQSFERTIASPWSKRAQTTKGKALGLCIDCDKAIFPPKGREMQWEQVPGAVRRLGGSIVIGGTNWTGPASPDIDGFKKALDDMNCTGQGRIDMLRQMEHAIEEAARFAILNAVPAKQFRRYKLVITVENCIVEYTTVPAGDD